MRRSVVASSLVLALAAASHAQVTLSAVATADNAFTAYISTTPGLPGDSFLSGNDWTQTFSASTVLPGPGTYYLHIAALDFGAPMMLIGRFSLSDSAASFQNGLQELVTDPTNWRVSISDFTSPGVVPADLGPNGITPWGNFPAMTPDARFIWFPQPTPTAFFTTVITVVPAPASILMIAGLVATGCHRRR